MVCLIVHFFLLCPNPRKQGDSGIKLSLFLYWALFKFLINFLRSVLEDSTVTLIFTSLSMVQPSILARHQYDQLPDGFIRLVSLAPGEPDASFDCNFVGVPHDEAPEYEALSYVWGDAAYTENLLCGEGSIPITLNLAAALRRLRSSVQQRLIWIDQLSINQNDTEERSRQVSRMTSIFRNARLVLMWMGEDTDGLAAIARDFIYDIASRRDLLVLEFADDIEQTLQQHQLPGTQAPEWRALNHLLQLPYFERIWIVQEVKLAASAEVLWGDCVIDWESLKVVFDWVYKSTALRRRYNDEDAPLIDPLAARRSVDLSSEYRSLEAVIGMSVFRKSTDERDKIYGVLGLVEEGSNIEVDYSKSVKAVFADLTRYVIRTRQTLDILSGVDRELLADDDWPTWVPRPKPRAPEYLAYGRNFLASANEPVAFEQVVDGRDLTLILKGIMHSVAEKVGSVVRNPEAVETTWEGLRIWNDGRFCSTGYQLAHIADAWDHMMRNASPPSGDGPLVKAFLWTFLCGAYDVPQNGSHSTVWQDQIYLDFAKFWAFLLWSHGFYGQSDLQTCLRHYLGLADSAIDACGGPLGQEQLRDETSWKTELLDKKDSEENQQWFDFRTRIKDDISVYHSDDSTIEKASGMLSAFFALDGEYARFATQYLNSAVRRRFFITERGSIGMGPSAMKDGDVLVILFGGKTPYILRPIPSGHLFIGECYVHDLMHGEAIKELRDTGELESCTRHFTLC